MSTKLGQGLLKAVRELVVPAKPIEDGGPQVKEVTFVGGTDIPQETYQSHLARLEKELAFERAKKEEFSNDVMVAVNVLAEIPYCETKHECADEANKALKILGDNESVKEVLKFRAIQAAADEMLTVLEGVVYGAYYRDHGKLAAQRVIKKYNLAKEGKSK